MSTSKNLLRSLSALALVTLSIALCWGLPQLPFLRIQALYQNIDHMFYDLNWKLFFKLTDNATGDSTSKKIEYNEDRIFIIDIDDKALKDMGAYNTWTREPHATVIHKLNQAGASAIVFDIMFKDANYGQRATQRMMQALQMQKAHQVDSAMLRHSLDDDRIFVNAVSSNPNVIVNGTVGNPIKYPFAEDQKALSSPERIAQLNTRSFFHSSWLPSDTLRMQLLDDIFPELLQKSHRFGLTNVIADPDGIHRREPLLYSFPDPKFKFSQGTQAGLIPSLALQTCLHLLSLNPDQIRIHPGEFMDLGPALRIYLNAQGQLQTSYPQLSASMIADLIQNKDSLLHYIEIADTATQPRQIEISPLVAVHRDSSGSYSADILNGQLLPEEHLLSLAKYPHLIDTAKLKAQGAALHVSFPNGFVLSYDSSEKMPLLSSPDEDSYNLNWQTLQILSQSAQQILSLRQDSHLHLSTPLHARMIPSLGALRTEILVLSPAVLKDLLKWKWSDLQKIKPGDTLGFGPPIHIPIDQDGRMFIRYVGPYENSMSQRLSFPTVSYQQFVSGDQDANLASYQGKVAILGSTIAAMFDRTNTPFATEYPGPLIHANLIQNILNQNFMQPLKPMDYWLILGAIALICGFAHAFFSPLWATLLSGISLLGYFVLQYELFRKGWMIGITQAFVCILSITLLGLITKYILENRERRKTVSMFKQYISPELIDQMITNEEMPTLGGQKSFLTAFFTDIASFSTFSEKIGDPVRLVELLNDYLSAMTDILMAEHGTLDKYEGDAIIAFFGAPVPIENNARSACLAALGMQAKLRELRLKWQSQTHDQQPKWPQIVHHMHMRIGLNSGMIVTGNMGSEMRKNYTMMGDAVNLAARLESGAKQYGVYTMISQATLEAAGEGFVCRLIDRIRVIGKSDAVEVHELLNTLEHASASEIELCQIHAQAMQAYFAQNWDQAIELFEQCETLEPHHPLRDPGSHTCPSLVMIQRCLEFQKHPPVSPGEVWDGIFTASEK